MALLPLLLFAGISPLVHVFRCGQDGSVHFSKCCADTSDDGVAVVDAPCCDLISNQTPLVPADLVHASDVAVSGIVVAVAELPREHLARLGHEYRSCRSEPRAGPPIILLKRSFLI